MTGFAFLHGGGQGGWVWAETIAALRLQGESAPMLALDAPGCGTKRGQATEGLAMADVARELIADIAAAGLCDVTLIGHSQAGQAIPIMARMRPDLFRRLIYVTCSSPLPGQSVLEMLGNGLHDSDPNMVGWPLDPRTTTVADRFEAMFCNDMTAAQTQAFLAAAGRDMWPARTYSERDWRYGGDGRIDAGAVPASFVICLKDMSLPVPWQERFAARLGAERLMRLDAGHQAMMTRPQALAEIIRKEAAMIEADR